MNNFRLIGNTIEDVSNDITIDIGSPGKHPLDTFKITEDNGFYVHGGNEDQFSVNVKCTNSDFIVELDIEGFNHGKEVGRKGETVYYEKGTKSGKAFHFIDPDASGKEKFKNADDNAGLIKLSIYKCNIVKPKPIYPTVDPYTIQFGCKSKSFGQTRGAAQASVGLSDKSDKQFSRVKIENERLVSVCYIRMLIENDEFMTTNEAANCVNVSEIPSRR